ncbi:hypothetical protein [Streptomyces sp. NPDC001652]|uniref:hypothetical protein n=1 Tax=Streptomyces sp. NPDC001652 TaxID=3154393 RepID=UPI0033190437
MNDPLQPSADSRRRPLDTAMAAALFACAAPGSLVTLPGHALRVPWWPGVLPAGVARLALPWHRGRPRGRIRAGRDG